MHLTKDLYNDTITILRSMHGDVFVLKSLIHLNVFSMANLVSCLFSGSELSTLLMTIKKSLSVIIVFLGTKYGLRDFPVLSVPYFFLHFSHLPSNWEAIDVLENLNIHHTSTFGVGKNLSNP